MALTVKRLDGADIEGVTLIHMEQFPRSRSTSLGRPYVRMMYRWFLEEQPGLSVAVTDGGRPVGFAVGAIGGYGRRIFRYALPEVAWGLISHPRLLLRGETFNLWTSYAKALLPAPKRADGNVRSGGAPVKASLASIAVARSAQGRGAGRALMSAFEEAAKLSGATLLGLSVEADNVAARGLYEACGWVVTGDRAGSTSVYYTKEIE